MSNSSAKAILSGIPAREWRGLVPVWQGGRLQVPLKCATCHNTDHWSATRVLSPDRVIPKIIQLGWRVDGSLICPGCIALHGRKKARDGDIPAASPRLKLIEDVMSSTNVTKLETQTPKLLDDLKRNKRLVILALEDYYDEAAHAYRPGKNDKVVADELNLSPGFVVNVREEFYGKLVEPDEIGELRSDIVAARKIIDDLDGKLTGLCNRNGWKV